MKCFVIVVKAISSLRFSQKAPSWKFDWVVNTSLSCNYLDEIYKSCSLCYPFFLEAFSQGRFFKVLFYIDWLQHFVALMQNVLLLLGCFLALPFKFDILIFPVLQAFFIFARVSGMFCISWVLLLFLARDDLIIF